MNQTHQLSVILVVSFPHLTYKRTVISLDFYILIIEMAKINLGEGLLALKYQMKTLMQFPVTENKINNNNTERHFT